MAKDISKVCRTCLLEDQGAVSIFCSNGEFNTPYSHLLEIIARVEVRADDALPSCLCASCIERLVAAYRYVEQVQRFDRQLRGVSLDVADGLKVDNSPEQYETEHLDEEAMLDYEDGEDYIYVEAVASDDIGGTGVEVPPTSEEVPPVSEGVPLASEGVPLASDEVPFASEEPSPTSLTSREGNEVAKVLVEEMEEVVLHLCSRCGITCKSASMLKTHALKCLQMAEKSTRKGRTKKRMSAGMCGLCQKSLQKCRGHEASEILTERKSLSVQMIDKSNSSSDIFKCPDVPKDKPKKKSKLKFKPDYKVMDSKGTSGEGTNTCVLCRQSFGNIGKLLIHLRDEHNLFPKKNQAKSASSQVKVERSRVGPKPVGRKSCSIPVRGVPLKYEEVRKEDRPRCGVCSRLFCTQAELDLHFWEHGNTEALVCSLCEKIYLKFQHFKKHFAELHPDVFKGWQESDSSIQSAVDTLRYQRVTTIGDLLTGDISMKDINQEIEVFVQGCALCGELLLSAASLQAHYDANHQDIGTRCHLCAKTFPNVKTAEKHRVKCAGLECRHECEECGERFEREATLTRHVRNEHTDVEELYMSALTCALCGQHFSTRAMLAKHKRLHLPSYECEICKKKFRKIATYEKHKESHDPSRPRREYLCMYCGASLRSADSLTVHIRRHTGERPFVCAHCGRGFAQKKQLSWHTRVHTGERPYPCTLCPKVFRRQQCLARHMRVHTGTKPYACPHCARTFAQSFDLVRHVRHHTGERAYKCGVCEEEFVQKKELEAHRALLNHGESEDRDSYYQILMTSEERHRASITGGKWKSLSTRMEVEQHSTSTEEQRRDIAEVNRQVVNRDRSPMGRVQRDRLHAGGKRKYYDSELPTSKERMRVEETRRVKATEPSAVVVKGTLNPTGLHAPKKRRKYVNPGKSMPMV